MLPILPLIIGAATGAAATQLMRSKAVQQGIRNAGNQLRNAGGALRQAASDGLDSVRETGAQVRRKVADTLRRHDDAHDDGSAYEDAGALLLPAPHEDLAPGRKKPARGRSNPATRTRQARSANASQAGASPKGSRRASTARAALEKASLETTDDAPPRRRPRNRTWPPTTKRSARTAAAPATQSPSESKTDDDAGQH